MAFFFLKTEPNSSLALNSKLNLSLVLFFFSKNWTKLGPNSKYQVPSLEPSPRSVPFFWPIHHRFRIWAQDFLSSNPRFNSDFSKDKNLNTKKGLSSKFLPQIYWSPLEACWNLLWFMGLFLLPTQRNQQE